MAKKTGTETAAQVTPVSKFSKDQILKSQRYRERRDILSALLEDGKEYSHAEAEALTDDFMKGKVK